MCLDPLTIAGIAASLGSAVANNAAAGKVSRARDAALAAESERQARLDREAEAVNAQSRGRYKNFSGDQSGKARELSDYFSGQNKAVDKAGAAQEPALTPSTSSIVNAEEAKQKGKAAAYGTQQNASLGQLRSFGDLLGAISRAQGVDAQRVGTIAGFKRGSQAVLPLELEAANGKGRGLRTLGAILGAGGSVATAAGLGGGWDKLFSAAKPTVLTSNITGAGSAVGSVRPVAQFQPSSLGGLY